VAREVLSDLEVRVAQTRAVVEIQSLPVIQADPLLMRQLLQNLVVNALKFHKADTPPLVKIWCEGGDPRGDAGEFLYLHIQDNGIGFDEQHLEKMFLPFMRLHARGSYEGSGIGLSICRKIVERHGGTITAKSSPGSGATFTVALPLQEHPGNG
jgi:signal transduction histidine kinase